MLSLLLYSAAVLSLTAIGAAEDTWQVGQAVKTTSGDVTGRPANYAGNEQVSEYLGIPYAAPPVGNLRWLAPQPYQANGTIAANKFVSTIEERFKNGRINTCSGPVWTSSLQVRWKLIVPQELSTRKRCKHERGLLDTEYLD